MWSSMAALAGAEGSQHAARSGQQAAGSLCLRSDMAPIGTSPSATSVSWVLWTKCRVAQVWPRSPTDEFPALGDGQGNTVCAEPFLQIGSWLPVPTVSKSIEDQRLLHTHSMATRLSLRGCGGRWEYKYLCKCTANVFGIRMQVLSAPSNRSQNGG